MSAYAPKSEEEMMTVKTMQKTVEEIAQAQDFLKERYGESGYREMLRRLQTSIAKHGGSDVELLVLVDVADDDTVGATVRLVAIAAMGED
jgi:hypothetical protein